MIFLQLKDDQKERESERKEKGKTFTKNKTKKQKQNKKIFFSTKKNECKKFSKKINLNFGIKYD